MNKDFEDIKRGIQTMIDDVKPEHLAYAITQYVVSLDEAKRFKAGEKEPRIKLGREDKSDGWRGRVAQVLDIEDKARGGL